MRSNARATPAGADGVLPAVGVGRGVALQRRLGPARVGLADGVSHDVGGLHLWECGGGARIGMAAGGSAPLRRRCGEGMGSAGGGIVASAWDGATRGTGSGAANAGGATGGDGAGSCVVAGPPGTAAPFSAGEATSPIVEPGGSAAGVAGDGARAGVRGPDALGAAVVGWLDGVPVPAVRRESRNQAVATRATRIAAATGMSHRIRAFHRRRASKVPTASLRSTGERTAGGGPGVGR